MSDDKTKTGIERAIEFAGRQTVLAELLSHESGEKIPQHYISRWLGLGYVPANRVALVARVTGVPVEDLIQQPRQRGR